MPRNTTLIEAIEAERNSRVVTFFTGDRENQQIQIGDDAQPILAEHLARIGQTDRLDLVIYSRGGHTLSGFAMANSLREYSRHVGVLVPFRAHSCATLIALGADEIVIGPFGQLSPIDPSITTPHGPSIEENGQRKYIPVSVEDVANYIELAKQEAGQTTPEMMAGVFSHLSTQVNPLALGAVYRAREQIGMLADKLLALHIPDKARRDQIVRTMARELLSHDYIINRREAQTIGLPVVNADGTLGDLLWQLYTAVAAELHLAEPWDPASASGTVTAVRGLIESRDLRHEFTTTYRISKTPVTLPGGKRGEELKIEQGNVGWKLVP